MEAFLAFFVTVGEDLWRLRLVIAYLDAGWVGLALMIVLFVSERTASFEQIRDILTKPGFAARYRDFVGRLLAWSDRETVFGQLRPWQWWSWQGYSLCLRFAFAYPFMFWLLAWAMGGPGRLAGVPLLDEDFADGARALVVLAVLATVSLLVLLSFYLDLDRIWQFTKSCLEAFFDRLGLSHTAPVRRYVAHVAMVAAFAIAAGFAGGDGVAIVALVAVLVFGLSFLGVAGSAIFMSVAAGAAVSAGTAISSGVGVMFVAGVAFVAVLFAAGGGGLGSFAFIALAFFVMSNVSDTSVAGVVSVYVALLLVIPAANALLDTLSVNVSRKLLRHLAEHPGGAWQGLAMAGHVLMDLLLALIFLVLLALVLPAVLQVMNLINDALGWPAVEWWDYIKAAQRDPFGTGLMATGMLITTLIPTALHLFAAGFALFLPLLGGGQAVARLAAQDSTTNWDRCVFLFLIGASAALSWVMLAVTAVVLWNLVQAAWPFAGNLADLALAVGRSFGPDMPVP